MYRQNLIILRDFIKDNKLRVQRHLKMSEYYTRGSVILNPTEVIGKFPQCGTSCCLIGWCAHIPGLREQITDTTAFFKVSEVLFNMSDAEDVFHHLFGSHNPNNVDNAVKRLDEVIGHA